VKGTSCSKAGAVHGVGTARSPCQQLQKTAYTSSLQIRGSFNHSAWDLPDPEDDRISTTDRGA
jgi:hypothetical protein